MQLTEDQAAVYDRHGSLFLPNHLSQEEVEALLIEAVSLCSVDSPKRILEKNGASCSIYLTPENRSFHELARLPKMLGPAKQLLRSDVYIHQAKLNPKVARHGSAVEWHRDFLYWHRLDGMPTDRVLTAAVLLHNVGHSNAPLMLLPGSHKGAAGSASPTITNAKAGGEDACHPSGQGWNNTRASGESIVVGDLKWTVEPPANSECIESVVGPSGSVLFFHGNLAHGSAHNDSSRDRFMAFITYNSVENALADIPRPRPEFVASRKFVALQPLLINSLRPAVPETGRPR